jgi:hypothetical protein
MMNLAKPAAWVPLAIAAGYFVFLIAMYTRWTRDQTTQMEKFEAALETWTKQRERDVPSAE